MGLPGARSTPPPYVYELAVDPSTHERNAERIRILLARTEEQPRFYDGTLQADEEPLHIYDKIQGIQQADEEKLEPNDEKMPED